MAVPILIHLLARRRFKRIRWAAIDFLVDAERRNRRRIRMEEWILLALRCLAILLIALIVSRPFFKPTGLAFGWGKSARTERVFVIDDSFSMGYLSAEQESTSFDRAKLAVRRVLQGILRETPDDTVTIARMSGVESPIVSSAFLRVAESEELFSRLDALTTTEESIDPQSVMESVADLLAREPGITSAAVYVISDFQRHNWIQPEAPESGDSEGGGKVGAFGPLMTWVTQDRAMRLVLINVGDERAANTAITSLAVQGGRLVAGTTATIRATVANHASGPVENLRLDTALGQIMQSSKVIRELAPHQRASIDLDLELAATGFHTVRAELPPDPLPIDNVRYLAANVAGAIRILIVNGEPSRAGTSTVDSFDDEVAFLATALRPEGEVFSGHELRVVDEVELEDVNLAAFHTVILANVYRISEPAVESLEQYVHRGGGLIVFLGDQVDAGLYNAALYREGDGLLPAQLTEIKSAAGEAHLVVADRLHPAMRGLSLEGDPLGIGLIPFFQYFRCVPFEALPDQAGEQSDQTEPRPSGSGHSRPARVIARFDDAEENAAIIERPLGRGRVVLITTAADKEWHQWPDHPTYLPVMTELVRHVASRGDRENEHLVGSTIELPIDPALLRPEVIVRTPMYPAEPEISVTAVPVGDNPGLTMSWEHTDVSGMYQFIFTPRQGGAAISREQERAGGLNPRGAAGDVSEDRTPLELSSPPDVTMLAVNVDPSESDLATVQQDELRRTMEDVPFEYVEGLDMLGLATAEAGIEFWRFFLIAAVSALMVEQFLAWKWGRSR